MSKQEYTNFAVGAANHWEGPKSRQGEDVRAGGFALQEVMEGEPVRRRYPPTYDKGEETDPGSIFFRNDPNGLFAVGTEPYDEFLKTCLQENLNHLRHVENERITFLSLYLVGVGMLLDVAITNGGMLAVVMMCLLLVLNWISYTLVKRWNKVFDGHNRIAKRIVAMVDSQGRAEEDPYFPEGWEKDPRFKDHRHHMNYYYYFDNKAGEAAYSEWEKKHPAPPKKKGKAYIHTAELFEVFNIAIFGVEVIFLVFFIMQLF